MTLCTNKQPSSVVLYTLSINGLEPDLPLWSHWMDARRIEKASRFRRIEDRALCIGAGLLLAFALTKHCPSVVIPPDVSVDHNGKPYLPGMQHFHFNISHSGSWVVCAVSNKPLGVDIEQSGQEMSAIVKTVYTSTEQKYLNSLPQGQQNQAALEQWVLKESFMKALGAGFALPMQEFTVMPGPPAWVKHEDRIFRGITLCPFPDTEYRCALTVCGAPGLPEYDIVPIEIDSIVEAFGKQ